VLAEIFGVVKSFPVAIVILRSCCIPFITPDEADALKEVTVPGPQLDQGLYW
jgi:hypothetical protein